MKTTPALAAALTGVQVGATIVATRFVVGQTDPASLALLRYLIGFCCLAPVVLVGRRPRVAARDLAPIALLGIVQFGVLVALLNEGLRHVPAARGALIFATFPVLTMLLAAALGHERLSPARAAGVLLSVGGVGLALGPEVAAGGDGAWRGELTVFASACCGAVCSVLYRPYLRRYPALPVGALAMLGSVAFLAPFAAREGLFTDGPRFTPGGWLAVVGISAGSAAGYLLWLWALARADATRVTVFLALSPVSAVVLGALFLKEPVTGPALLGLGCVAAGLLLTQRGRS